MSWRTSHLTRSLRSLARRAGVSRTIGSLLARHGYEQDFDGALLRCVGAGQCVWDVGGNVGYYAVKMAAKVGAEGRVFVWEPSATNRDVLFKRLESLPNCRVLPYALGADMGMMYLEKGADDIGATSRVVTMDGPGREAVQLTTADRLIATGAVEPPNVVKIDAEGYELDILLGMKRLLQDPILSALGIEVHFGLLEERGQASAPANIERLLAKNGFRTSWTDSSHLIATRGAVLACIPE